MVTPAEIDPQAFLAIPDPDVGLPLNLGPWPLNRSLPPQLQGRPELQKNSGRLRTCAYLKCDLK